MIKQNINYNDIDGEKLDALKEVSNIGAGNAATALGKLVRRRIDMEIPTIKVLEFRDVGTILEDEEKVVVGVMIQIVGEIKGMLLLILDSNDAVSLVETLTGKKNVDLSRLDDIEGSAICETGNVLGGAYLSALATFTNLDIRCSEPEIVVDMAAAILSLPAINSATLADNVLYIDTKFAERGKTINSTIFIVPEGDSLLTLLNALGV